jgi:transcriptional regulator with GAF, ATPase, and Fis domain
MATSHGPGSPVAPHGEPASLTADHLARLLELARALSGVNAHAEIATVAAMRARAVAGASEAQVCALGRGGGLTILAVAAEGAPAFRPRRPSTVRAGGPERDVVRSGGPIWVGSRRDAFDGDTDVVLDARPGGRHAAAWAFLPLVADDEVSGVLSLAFPEEQAFDGATRAFLSEVASACGSALARGSLFTQAHDRATASEAARAAGAARELSSDRRADHRTRLYERERFARARAEAETVAGRPSDALVVQYDEIEVDGPVTRILGVFSSEASTRDALRKLELARSLVVRATITTWTLDEPDARARVDLDLSR